MSYRITYGPDKYKRKIHSKIRRFWPLLAGLGVLCLAAVLQFTGFAEQLKQFLLPGDPAVTEAALETMIANLRDGQGLSYAVTAFCMEILENAQFP